MSSEQEILDEITAVEGMQRSIRIKLSQAKLAVIDNESLLVTASLKLDKLKEELRVFRLRNPIQEETAREKDIREFKARVPELMEKIK